MVDADIPTRKVGNLCRCVPLPCEDGSVRALSGHRHKNRKEEHYRDGQQGCTDDAEGIDWPAPWRLARPTAPVS